MLDNQHVVGPCQGAHAGTDVHGDPADVVAADLALDGVQPAPAVPDYSGVVVDQRAVVSAVGQVKWQPRNTSTSPVTAYC